MLLSNMFGYATAIRSKTQGRGQYSMEPSHYTEVPKSIAESIMAGRAKKRANFPLSLPRKHLIFQSAFSTMALQDKA